MTTRYEFNYDLFKDERKMIKAYNELNFIECKTVEEANAIDLTVYTFLKHSEHRDVYVQEEGEMRKKKDFYWMHGGTETPATYWCNLCLGTHQTHSPKGKKHWGYRTITPKYIFR